MRTINYVGYRMVRGFRSIIYKSNGEIHYISGTDVLPVPLEGEEEKNASELLKRYDLFGHDPKGLYMLDSELAARVYTAPSLVL